jgi:competence protein ComEC
LGLLIGVGALIPKPLQLELQRVGLSHLVAVSGYNLTIIVRLVSRLLGRLGRNVALILSIWLIGVFVVISGASSSIVRAGVVSVVSLLVAHTGRRVDPLSLVSVAAAGTALYNPGYLNDIGWLLSFLAFFGILVLAPAVMARFGEPGLALGRMTIETLAAEILTLPLIVGVFSQLSIIGLVANLVIEPFVPLAMLVSLVAGLAGLWLPLVSDYLVVPSTLVLRFMLQLIGAMAALPWALTMMSLTTLQMLECYSTIVILTATLVWYNKTRNR